MNSVVNTWEKWHIKHSSVKKLHFPFLGAELQKERKLQTSEQTEITNTLFCHRCWELYGRRIQTNRNIMCCYFKFIALNQEFPSVLYCLTNNTAMISKWNCSILYKWGNSCKVNTQTQSMWSTIYIHITCIIFTKVPL